MSELELSDRDFERFRELVYQHSGISLSEKKRALIRARFGKEMRRLGLTSFAAYYDHVAADETGQSVVQMINAISTNLTSFFREAQHFEFLSRQLLPELVKAKRASGSVRLRGWSAGCSTGEEPYTLAMVVLENVPDPLGWDLRLLATDIDSDCLERAREGIYRKKQVEAVPPMLKGRYLEREGPREEPVYRVGAQLKRLVSFRHLNLMQAPWPFGGSFDFIFCRNVMIYFDRPTQEKLINRFYEVLNPGGVLFVGHSESLTGVAHRFQYIRPTVYRR